MGKWCDNHLEILRHVAAFNNLFASSSTAYTPSQTIGDMPFTLARYLQNQINVKSVLNDISPVEDIINTESIHVALSVCFAQHMELELTHDILSAEASLSTTPEMLSDDCDTSMCHDTKIGCADPNISTWLKTLHERAQNDQATITNFIIARMKSPEPLLQIKAIGLVMILSNCFDPLSEIITNDIMQESNSTRTRVLSLFTAETSAKERYLQEFVNKTALPLGLPVDGGTGVGAPVNAGPGGSTPVDGPQGVGAPVDAGLVLGTPVDAGTGVGMPP